MELSAPAIGFLNENRSEKTGCSCISTGNPFPNPLILACNALDNMAVAVVEVDKKSPRTDIDSMPR